MQNVYFEDFEDLAWDIAENFDNVREFDEYNDVAIIAKYEETRQIIKELLCIGYDIASIHLDSYEYGEYSDEYVITLTNVNGEDEIWTEPFKRESGYLTEEMKNGGKVQLVGFGTFEVSERAARTGRNPQTGETIEIKASKAPKFKAGKALKDTVNA